MSLPRIIFIATILFIFSCNEPEPIPCSNIQDLGFYPNDNFLPYNDFLLNDFENKSGEKINISINHPSSLVFDGVNIENTIEETSACQGIGMADQFTWTVVEKNAIIQTTFGQINPDRFLIKERKRFIQENENQQEIENYISFFALGPNGGLSSEAFMIISTSQNTSSNTLQFGVDYVQDTTICNVNFNSVYINKMALSNDVKNIIYSLEKGAIGFIDKNSVLWHIKE